MVRKPLAIILLAPESAGNHAACSLFSQLRLANVPLLGTDLAGWTDGKFKGHDVELFHSVWQREKSLDAVAHGQSFVTSRSIPCGNWPPLRHFYAQCGGYTTQTVVLTRDRHIVRRSARAWGHPAEIEGQPSDMPSALQWLWKNLPPRSRLWWLSYEALTQLKAAYFIPWVRRLHPSLSIDLRWFDFLRDENEKYFKQE